MNVLNLNERTPIVLTFQCKYVHWQNEIRIRICANQA